MILAGKTAALWGKFGLRFARVKGYLPRSHAGRALNFLGPGEALAAVNQAAVELEARFLEISTTIEETTVTGEKLVKSGEALAAAAIGEAGGQRAVEAAAAHIWECLAFVEASIEESEQLIGRLKTTSRQLNGLLGAEKTLSRTLAPLSFVQSLFRVESVRLAPEYQAMFSALVLNIEQVRRSVEEQFRDKFQLVRDIQLILGRAIEQLVNRAATARRRVVEFRKHLTATLEKMNDSHQRTREREARLAEVSRAVAAETGKVVMSLQFYDAFTQKLQHARTILGEMETRAGGRGADARTVHFLHQAGQVAGAQIAEMTTGLMQAGETVKVGIRGIGQQMAIVDQDCCACREGDQAANGRDGAVQILLDALKDVQHLVEDAASFATESHATIRPIGGKTTNFTQFIENLSFEIQLIGLNAEVQSTQIGRGTGLEVLSAQTSAVSRETTALSSQIASDVDHLTLALEEMVRSFEEIRARSIQFSTTFCASAASDEAALLQYRDSSVRILAEMGELLPTLKTQTATALEQADLVSIATAPLTALQAAIGTFTVAAESRATKLSAPEAGLTDHFLKLYTMSSEVDVHRRALGQTVPPPAAPAAAMDDFTLFEEAPAPAAGGDVELFGFDEPAAPVATPAAPADNVLWFDSSGAEPAVPFATSDVIAAPQDEAATDNTITASAAIDDRTRSESAPDSFIKQPDRLAV